MTQAIAPTVAAPQAPEPLQVLSKFFALAWSHSHGGARVAARLLLGLYNSRRFPFELDELRVLDSQMLTEALTLMRFDARPQCEVHIWLNQIYGRHDFGMRFEHLAHMWGMKGKCQKSHLEPVERIELEGGAQ